MALLLAAHDVQPGDHKITNELGVLYARFGELNKAELMLKRSLIAREHAESWHNLSRVWEMAGKDELSHYASQRSGQLKQVGVLRDRRAYVLSSRRFLPPALPELPDTPCHRPPLSSRKSQRPERRHPMRRLLTGSNECWPMAHSTLPNRMTRPSVSRS